MILMILKKKFYSYDSFIFILEHTPDLFKTIFEIENHILIFEFCNKIWDLFFCDWVRNNNFRVARFILDLKSPVFNLFQIELDSFIIPVEFYIRLFPIRTFLNSILKTYRIQIFFSSFKFSVSNICYTQIF